MTVRFFCLGFGALLSLFSFSGCIFRLENSYESSYLSESGGTGDTSRKSIEGKRIPIIFETSESDFWDIIEEGYEVIGRSVFSGRHCSWTCAMDTGKKVGADLIMIKEEFKQTREYNVSTVVPVTSHSVSSGNINTYSYGENNSSWGGGTYSSYTTNTTYVPVQTKRYVNLYEQRAIFFRKIDVNGQWGVRYSVPPLLPGDDPTAQITVKVVAVLKGSQASRLGFKRGDIIVKINGEVITTRADIEPYVLGKKTVKSMEVQKQ